MASKQEGSRLVGFFVGLVPYAILISIPFAMTEGRSGQGLGWILIGAAYALPIAAAIIILVHLLLAAFLYFQRKPRTALGIAEFYIYLFVLGFLGAMVIEFARSASVRGTGK